MDRSYKILLTEPIDKSGLKLLREVGTVIITPDSSEETLMRLIVDADALIIKGFSLITEDLMKRGRRLKVIGRHGVGVDNIDVDAATRLGIPVVYTPNGPTESTADHTIGLMIAVAKMIPQSNYALKFEGNWNIRYEFRGVEIWGKTLGIIGLGRIGSRVAKRARGFDMRVLAYDPYTSEKVAKGLGVKLVDLQTLLRESDFVTIHVPLTSETQGMIGRDEIQAMMDGAFLINVARGEVVDEGALYEALIGGKLAGAALDVFTQEPPSPENPLFKLENVVVTPHNAAFTEEALRRMATTVAEEVIRVLKGRKPRYLVNPSVLGIGKQR